MDNVTMIRIVAGVIALILLAILIARRKRMAAARRTNTKR
jgi:LPXTG-motif cell wall-anchored protein